MLNLDGNIGLKPEYSHNYNLGLGYQHSLIRYTNLVLTEVYCTGMPGILSVYVKSKSDQASDE
ncbi:hypothetical protein CS542_07005 [Pedobacter sp. IW39]|nr:hypothetical protein CS542_07005 [Pedobacter sp. IW39]